MYATCEVCQKNSSKYKCSTCYCPYCSLNCWKIHKIDDNCKVKKKTPDKNNVLSNTIKNKYFTEDTIAEEKLSQLGENKTLKNILSNKYLQSTLITIDNASNPEEAIKQAMKDPEFVEFVDECLKTVEDFPNQTLFQTKD